MYLFVKKEMKKKYSKNVSHARDMFNAFFKLLF